MAPLIVHLVVWGLAWGVGLAGIVPQLSAPVEAFRIGFAAMFVLTGVAHFVPRTRTEMRSMVPPAMPVPFPANVHAARTGLQIAGRRAMPVGPRLALQLFWVAGLLWIVAAAFHSRAT